MNHWSKNHSLQEQASDVVRKHMVITGLVQGVGFRYFTVIQARQLGVSGWGLNRYDGSVEVEAQGSQESVQALVKQLKLGPRWSDVRHIDIQDVPVKDDAPSAFRVLE